MKMSEYLKQSKNYDWDFTEEYACDAYREIDNSFEKFFVYRSQNYSPSKPLVYLNAYHFIKTVNENYGRVQDPDIASELLQEIYQRLWPDLVKCDFMLNKGRIQSDTMTSAQKSFNEIVMKYIETNDEKILRRKNRVSTLYCLDLYNRDQSSFLDRLNEINGLSDFIDSYHTLGNYIAVPNLFNAARSGLYSSHDYWDLTLQKVHEWYYKDDIGNNDYILKELLHHKGDVDFCRSWLDYFGKGEKGWINFIERYYLQDFVDSNYCPVPFCSNHSWDTPQISNYSEFLAHATERIRLRGRRMFEAIR